MNKRQAQVTLAPNAVQSCGTEAARRRHAAHAEDCPTCITTGSPVVTIDPAVRFGRPHIHGISTVALAEAVLAQESAEVVAKQYGLTRSEVLVACWFQSVHVAGWPAPRHWGDWARGAYDAMRHGRWNDVEDPPDPAAEDAHV